MNIKSKIDKKSCKKIFSNSSNKKIYLSEFEKMKNIDLGTYKSKSSEYLDNLIINNWDYYISSDIIRKMFKNSEKYNRGIQANSLMKKYLKEWKKLELGSVRWPFSQGQFDNYVQSLNKKDMSDFEKDKEIKHSALKFRRLKEINTLRNDYLEKLIFDLNENIIPTLNHSRGVDFYIDGLSFDQKVSKSVTKEFKDKYPNKWRDVAIKNPEKVAKYLYTYQDEGRFGADNRLLIVYIDEDISSDRIYKIIQNTSLDKTVKIDFNYNHKDSGVIKYSVNCFIIMLYNK